MRRKIVYVTGTRADFGLMSRALRILDGREDIELSVVTTGMHLSTTYGGTENEVAESGLSVVARPEINVSGASGADMGLAVGELLEALIRLFQDNEPDAVVVIGDRGEMLAAALAAVYMNVHVFHVHGGERSGTIDESVRHAISKLSHFHLVATEESRQRLLKMGEREDSVVVTGAPGLDDIAELTFPDRSSLFEPIGFDPDRQAAIVVYHPVLVSYEDAREEFMEVYHAVVDSGIQVLFLTPNSDAGSQYIREALDELDETRGLVVRSHLSRNDFLAWLGAVDVFVGNSSAGIIEAASFGTPVVNVGPRQALRQRNTNVTDVDVDRNAVRTALNEALEKGRLAPHNVYGDGEASRRIARYVATQPLDRSVLQKSNVY